MYSPRDFPKSRGNKLLNISLSFPLSTPQCDVSCVSHRVALATHRSLELSFLSLHSMADRELFVRILPVLASARKHALHGTDAALGANKWPNTCLITCSMCSPSIYRVSGGR